MFTKVMMWISIVVVLLALLGLPITSGNAMRHTVICASAVLVIRQAIRSGQTLIGLGFIPVVLAFSPYMPIAISDRVFLWLNVAGLAAFLIAVTALKTELTLSMPSMKRNG